MLLLSCFRQMSLILIADEQAIRGSTTTRYATAYTASDAYALLTGCFHFAQVFIGVPPFFHICALPEGFRT